MNEGYALVVDNVQQGGSQEQALERRRTRHRQTIGKAGDQRVVCAACVLSSQIVLPDPRHPWVAFCGSSIPPFWNTFQIFVYLIAKYVFLNEYF